MTLRCHECRTWKGAPTPGPCRNRARHRKRPSDDGPRTALFGMRLGELRRWEKAGRPIGSSLGAFFFWNATLTTKAERYRLRHGLPETWRPWKPTKAATS